MFGQARFVACAAMLLATFVMSTPAFGAECIGVQFPDSVKAAESELVLNGLGIRKATLFKVKVYVAGLYLPAKSTDAGKILGANQAWQLTLQFVHDVDASEIRDAFDEGFTKAAGDKRDALGKRIEALNAQMVDFGKGQYLSYGYDPAKGVIVDANGATGAPIEGGDFATALLAISIGPEPPNEELKTGLLGGKCE
jgi:Chalcone isomerase-like